MEKEHMVVLLEAMRGICTHASLTGCLRDGRGYLVTLFNKLLQDIKTGNMVPSDSGLLTPLPDDASLDELGCAVSLILALMKHEMTQA